MIVGAGFGGLAAARGLAKSDGEVVVVDRHNFHTFQPLLYQVATGGLDPMDVGYPIRLALRRMANVSFVYGEAVDIDLDARAVILAGGERLDYDELVVATGARPAYFSVPGAKEHALTLASLADARGIRDRVLSILEHADRHPEAYSQGGPSFVIVGAGPTGVEIAGALVELIEVATRHDRVRLPAATARIVLVDGLERPLAQLSLRASAYAQRTLAERGVTVRLGEPVSEVSASSVSLASGEVIDADAVLWVAGIDVSGTLAAVLPGERAPGGRVVVEGDLSLAGHPEVFVIGDAAAPRRPPATAAGAPASRLWPQVAPVAIQGGRHVAAIIGSRQRGALGAPFNYRDRGAMATIGRRAAVAELGPRLVLRGTLGWLAWLGLHLVYLIGVRERIMVVLNWTWRYFGWPSGPRLILDAQPAALPHEAPGPLRQSPKPPVGAAPAQAITPDGETRQPAA